LSGRWKDLERSIGWNGSKFWYKFKDWLIVHYSSFTIMSVKVLIPTPLQKLTNDQATVDCDGGNVAEILESLEQSCPGIKARLCDDAGQLRRFVNFYVNSEDIRFLEGINTALKDGDEVSIVPAIAGG
jgi:molybdopterin synthase sulfur carrier subunit